MRSCFLAASKDTVDGLASPALTSHLAVPSIDVLIPFYAPDSLLPLKRAMESVYVQELQADSLIVVVNGGSVELRSQICAAIAAMEPFDASILLCVVTTQQLGIASALNLGIESSSAHWIARLDADDWMEPSRLRLMVQHLQACAHQGNPIPDVIGSSLWVHDQGRPDAPPWQMNKPCTDRAIRRALFRGNPFAHPSVLLRRDLLVAVGCYRPIKAAEDLDLWLRLARLPGVTFANLPEPLTHYTLVHGSLSHSWDSFLWSALCRLRHCKTPRLLLLHGPKIAADFLRFLLAQIVHG